MRRFAFGEATFTKNVTYLQMAVVPSVSRMGFIILLHTWLQYVPSSSDKSCVSPKNFCPGEFFEFVEISEFLTICSS
jgi:hypothetical protein